MTDWYSPATFPRFKNPPVVETVLALEFAPLAGLSAINLTYLQQSWLGEYPVLTEQAPLPPNRPAGMVPAFEVVQGAPQIRLWAETNDGSSFLLQTQNDRIVLNWRKTAHDGAYPGYAESRKRFAKALSQLTDFRDAHGLGSIVPIAVEFSYVNNITMFDESPIESAVSLVSHPDQEIPGVARFTRFQSIREVEQSTTDPFPAQVTITAQPLIGVEPNTLSLNISTRALLEDDAQDTVLRAADAAHALSSHTFAGITLGEHHSSWGRDT